MKIGRCQVISLNETILLFNDIVSCALFVLFYPMPFASVFIAIYIKEEMAYGTPNLISSWNISYILPLLMTMDKFNYFIICLDLCMNYLYIFINTILIWKDGTRRPVTCPAQRIMKQHKNTLMFQNQNCHYLALNFSSVASDKPFTLFNTTWYVIGCFIATL